MRFHFAFNQLGDDHLSSFISRNERLDTPEGREAIPKTFSEHRQVFAAIQSLIRNGADDPKQVSGTVVKFPHQDLLAIQCSTEIMHIRRGAEPLIRVIASVTEPFGAGLKPAIFTIGSPTCAMLDV